jgi:hypothetical protein
MVQFERSLVSVLLEEIQTPQPVFQVLTGPRQVGKTTIAHQVMGKLPFASVYASADNPLPPGVEWIETQWRRVQLEANRSGGPVLLVLDEVQKVQGWSFSPRDPSANGGAAQNSFCGTMPWSTPLPAVLSMNPSQMASGGGAWWKMP